MKRLDYSTLRLGLLPLILSPYLVAFTPNPSDSSSTSLEFAVGKGSYARVSRDCSGNVLSVQDIPFGDAGVAVDHHFSSFRVGAKAGVTSDAFYELFDTEYERTGQTVTYFDPNIGLDTKCFGLDVGGLFYGPRRSAYSSDPGAFPTGALRIGNRDSWYFSMSLANNLPLMTGGGLFDMGLGFNLGPPHSRLWLGVGVGPYGLGDPGQGKAAFSIKGDIPVSDKVLLNLRGQAGPSEHLEYGLSAGTKIIF